MVNRIKNGKTHEEIRERCKIAAMWIRENEVVNADEYKDLMFTISKINRESYRKDWN